MATYGINEFRQIGFMAADPELKVTSGGNKVTNFRVVTNSVWTDGEGARHERAEGFRYELWGEQAEHFCKLVKKGDRVHLLSELRNEAETNPDTSDKKYSIRFVVTSWLSLDRREKGV